MFKLQQKELPDDLVQSHFSTSPIKGSNAKFDSFLKRFKNFQSQYQVRRERAIQISQQNTSLQKVPKICQKSRTLVHDTTVVHERLYQKQRSSIKKQVQRSMSCERLTSPINTQMLSDRFISEFSSVIQMISDDVNKSITSEEFQVIMMNLGFLGYHLNEHQVTVNPNDHALILEMEQLLISQDGGKICQPTLLAFLLIIQGLCPNQTFKCDNQESLRTQQIQLQKQFLPLKYNRDQFILEKRRENRQAPRNSHSPSLSQKSIKLAKKRRKSLVDQVGLKNQKQTNLSHQSVDLHTVWNISELISSNKKNQLKKKLEADELQECKFRPALGVITNQINSLQVTPNNRLHRPKEQYQTVKRPDPECTFKPKITTKPAPRPPKSDFDPVRLRQIQNARKQHEFKSSMHQRGYPNDIKDWTCYVRGHKRQQSQPKPAPQPQKAEDVKKPILFVDITIGSSSDRLVVYPDQSVDVLVDEFAKKHNLDQSITKEFKKMLENKLRNILYPICEIQNSQNYDM